MRLRCGSLSISVLTIWLRELCQNGLVENTASGYALTATGRELFTRLEPLGDWAMEWVPKQQSQ